MGQTFFGLTDEYMQQVYEQIFNLIHHGNWSFSEAYSLPVGLRMWFFQRMVKFFEEKKKAEEEQVRKSNARR